MAGQRGGNAGERGGRDVRRALSRLTAAAVVPRGARAMSWARTGRQVGWGTCLEDNLAGLVWYVGFLVALGILAHVVQALAG